MSYFSDNIVILRKLEPKDLPFLYSVENSDENVLCGSVHNPLSNKDISDYITSSTGDIYKDSQLRLIVESASDNATLGIVDLYDFDIFNSRAAIGIYIIESERNKHYATRALTLLEKYAFNVLRLRLLYAFVSVENPNSFLLFNTLNYNKSSELKSFLRDSGVIYFYKLNPAGHSN